MPHYGIRVVAPSCLIRVALVLVALFPKLFDRPAVRFVFRVRLHRYDGADKFAAESLCVAIVVEFCKIVDRFNIPFCSVFHFHCLVCFI